jgi:hypothetical protein
VQAEQAFHRIQSEEAARKPVEPVVEILTVDQVAERLRERVTIEGACKSYRQNLESSPAARDPSAVPRRRASGSGVGSCDRVQQVGWHVRPFQGDEVAGVRELSELDVWQLLAVGLPV